MNRVLIIAEGTTEERFVKDIIIPYFQKKGLYNIEVSILPSKKEANGFRYKGGDISFEKVVKYVKNSLGSKYFVTTLIDYYGIDSEFRGYKESKKKSDIKRKKELLEQELAKEINDDKFLPYIQMYEFEGLLFSNPDSFKYIEDNSKKIETIKNEIEKYETPEHINDSKTTAPSKRLEKHYNGYTKTTDGIIVAKDIGIELMIEKCELFGEWIKKIEKVLKDSR